MIAVMTGGGIDMTIAGIAATIVGMIAGNVEKRKRAIVTDWTGE